MKRAGSQRGERSAVCVAFSPTTILSSEHRTFLALPISMLGYWGYPNFDIYAGGGYTPYASAKTTRDDVTSRQTLHGFQLLGGARVVLKSARNYRISAGLEAQQQFLNDASWTSVTGNFGLHL